MIGITEESVIERFLGFMQQVATYVVGNPEYKKQLLAPNNPADALVKQFLETSHGMPRQFPLLALVMLIHIFDADWKEEEKALTGPVQ